MSSGESFGLGFVVLAFFVLVILVIPQFSAGARLRRRLRKTHGRIISKSRAPSVKFSVKRPKK